MTYTLKKRISSVCACFAFILFLAQPVRAQKVAINKDISKHTFTYAIKDTSTLKLDIYTKPEFDSMSKRPCIIFVFGGAFIGGRRNDSLYNNYFNFLVEHNFVVASISYRLGLKGVKEVSAFHTLPLKNAINMAVEDLYDATNWVIAKADSINIDTSKIILSGSSAGAITVLESDFLKNNNKSISNNLPAGFKYAGVISFSGAVLSYDGKLKYATAPAPTLLFHGTEDKIVPYTKVRLFNKGFYGSSYIAKTFKKEGYYYCVVRDVGMGHEVSVLPMYRQLPLVLDFLNNYVLLKKPYQADMSFKNFEQQPTFTLSAKELFNKMNGTE